VSECTPRGIRIFHDQGKSDRFVGLTFPPQFGRNIIALAGVNFGNFDAFFESCTCYVKCHNSLFLTFYFKHMGRVGLFINLRQFKWMSKLCGGNLDRNQLVKRQQTMGKGQ
jgi:hypothetical protein